MEANVRFDHHLLAVEAEHTVHCMLELDAPAAPDAERPPLQIALVIDRSGSMAGPKLAAARECAAFLASRLTPADQLALVAFDDEVELISPLAPVEPTALAAKIAGIDAGGTTNLSGGWLKGIEELGRSTGDGTQRVLLLTDGQANVGITRRHQLVQIAAAGRGHAGTTTIGFGEGFDEDLLGAIAAASGANTYFAETPEDAPGIFAAEFEGLASLVAQNVSVEIRPTDRVQVLGLLNEYPTVAVPGGLQANLGDAYGDEKRRVVFELHIPQLAALGPAKVAEVVLRYVSVGGDTTAHEVTIPVVINLVSSDEAAAAEIDTEVTEEIWLLQAAKARRDAIEAVDRGDADGTRAALRSTADELRLHAPSAMRGPELAAEADALEAHVRSLDADDPRVWRKRLHNEEWHLNRGRRPPPKREGG